MAEPMRLLPIALLLALSASAMAQTMVIDSEHQVRIAFGDIPSTETTEPEGQWNVEHHLYLPEGENRTIAVPAGHALGVAYVNDGADFDLDIDGRQLTFTCNAADEASPDGTCLIHVPHSIGGSIDAFGMTMPVLDNHTVMVYTIDGLQVTTGSDNLVGPGFYYPDTNLLIHQYQTDSNRFWMTVQPTAVAEEVPTPSAITWQGIVIGLIVGAAIWFILVQQGLVQKRQRKQVAGTAAHKEVAKEGKATLEWRRRALLAAMKELELARADQNIDLEAYDILKADFKRQTVTVMRALEELGE